MKIGRVYKIIPNQGDEVYIGSTINEIRKRFYNHKKNYLSYLSGKTTKTRVYDIFDKYGTDNVNIILIKEYHIVDRLHLEAYETLWISKTKCVNKCVPFQPLKKEKDRQSSKNYRLKNKDIVNQKDRDRYHNNIEERKKRAKKFRENNVEKIKEQNKKNYEKNKEKRKEYAREYYHNNLDERKQRNKIYREINREKLKMRYREKIKCDLCDCYIARGDLSTHRKTKKHQLNLKISE
jgi:hypothetical protein